jgi:DNA mismatch repair ATPase MutL
MTQEEMQLLVEQLMASENLYPNPSGRKTFISITKEEMFRRLSILTSPSRKAMMAHQPRS